MCVNRILILVLFGVFAFGCKSKKTIQTKSNPKIETRSTSNTSTKINVLSLGAKGDGKANDTYAIVKANAMAAKANKTVYFPKGTYLLDPIKVTASWVGDPGTLIKNRSSREGMHTFCGMYKQNNLTIENLIFDGAVSKDPNAWSSNNYDTFTGDLAFYMENCRNIKIKNCSFRNSFKSNLRIIKSTDVNVIACKFSGARGNFGDGVYTAQYCKNITFTNCQASDYTRIGFVSENQSEDIYYDNCTAANGHDGSIEYGGRESNTGFWAENSGAITYNNCTANNNQHGGFVASIAKKINQEANQLTYSECSSVNSGLAYKIASSKRFGVDAFLYNCSGDERFYLKSNHPADFFKVYKCEAQVDFGVKTKNNIAYMWEINNEYKSTQLPEFEFEDCIVTHKNFERNKLIDNNTNSADFSCYKGGAAKIKIKNCMNANPQKAISVKSRTGASEFEFSNSTIEILKLKKGAQLSIINCELKGDFEKNVIKNPNYKVKVTR